MSVGKNNIHTKVVKSNMDHYIVMAVITMFDWEYQIPNLMILLNSVPIISSLAGSIPIYTDNFR